MKRFSLAACALVFGLVGSALAAPFQNGSFEVAAPCPSVFDVPVNDTTTIPGWKVVLGTIDLVGSCDWTAQDGSRSLDLLGSGKIGGIAQTFDTIPGATYQVSFQLAGNPGPISGSPAVKPLSVTVAGVTQTYTFDTTGHSGTSLGWTPQTFNFVASSTSSTITFVSDMTAAAAGFAGAALDNVAIVQTAGPTVWIGSGSGTPAPSGIAVLRDGTTGTGLAAFTYSVGLPPVQNGTVVTYPTPIGNGSWTFETTAVSAGTIVIPYAYTGYHAFFGVKAGLSAFVTHAGSTTTAPLVDAGPANCCVSPSNGFGYTGSHAFDVQPGDHYGFLITGSNADQDGRLIGTLTLPPQVGLVSSANPSSVGTSVDFTVSLAATAPTGTVTLIDNGLAIPSCTALPVLGVSVTCSLSSLAAGSHSIVATYSGDAANPASASFPVNQVVNAGAPASTLVPTIIRAIPIDSASGGFVARTDAALASSISYSLFTATSCVNGVLAGGIVQIDGSSTTDGAGIFGALVTGLQSGNFVAVRVNTPVSTPTSPCVAISGDNDFWPKALDIGAGAVQDFIDEAGKARWYKFSVAPGQKVQLSLSNLPADFDLVVFNDIYKAFLSQLVPADAAGLTKLSAEFAPSMFSPSMFSPSMFSPTTVSPDVYSPSMFSPSMFSPSMFSPSMFSPSMFSPSMFSPSMFSPSMFSPSMFSPGAYSNLPFTPPGGLGITQPEVAQAFSSAQTRSILAVAATPGLGNESVVLNTWSNTGNFYVRVAGRSGAFSTASTFTLNLAVTGASCANVSALTAQTRAPLGGSFKAIILTDELRMNLDAGVPPGTLRDRLTALAAKVGGKVVDVDADPRVHALKVQAANNLTCPYATNLVAEEIKAIVDSYRNPALRHVVIVGNDNTIPFFRYPDESLLGQESGYVPPVRNATASDASLSQDYVLGQDAYGAKTRIAMRGIDFPIPDLGVGRLVETPADIAGVIDAFLANGVVKPGSSLVTGYDFLASAATAVKAELQAGIGAAPDELIEQKDVKPQSSWTATALGNKLLGAHHDVVFLAGHFSANSALAADFTTSLLTTDLAASTTDFTNTIVFSAGCHAGYNIVDPDAIAGVTLQLDWPQAFAQKKATLIAGTGYQYGDTEFVEYSARLYANFSKQLRAGDVNTQVFVGDALSKAKADYLATTPDIRGIHQKALLETTLYGLPMLAVEMPFGRQPATGTTGAVTPIAVLPPAAAAQLGLQFVDLPVTPAFGAPNTLALSNLATSGTTVATWLSADDGVVINAGEPTLPLVVKNVTPNDAALVLRGIGLRGGNYTDSTVVPLTGAPTTELRGVHTPFLSNEFFPMRLATPNYFGALSGTGGTKLLITPAQHRAADVSAGTSTLRRFDGVTFRLYYSGELSAPTLSAAPTIVSVTATPDTNGVAFAARVVGDPTAAIHEVWVTYSTAVTATTGTWTSLSLVQCPAAACGAVTDTQVWMARLSPAPSTFKYIVQAVNGVGLVSADDNLGAYYSVGGAPPVATTLALAAPSSPAAYGGTVTVSATLHGPAGTVGSKPVTVHIGGAAQTGVTRADGTVDVVVTLTSLPGTYPVTASFAGDETLLPSSASVAGFVVSKASSSLAALSPLAGATLTGAIAGSPPIDGPVSFTVTSSRTPSAITVFANTNYLGQAIMPPPGLPAGTYSITSATFAGNATYNGTTLAFNKPFSIPKADQVIAVPQPTLRTFGDAFIPAISASSGLPVTLTPGGACTVSGASVQLTADGTCTITVSQAGNDDFNPATPVAWTFDVGKAQLIVTPSVTPPRITFGDDTASSPVVINKAFMYTGTAGSAACLLGGALPALAPALPASPVPAGTYSFVASIGALQFSSSCLPIVSNTGSLVVDKAQAAFAGIATSTTAAARSPFTITGQLHRQDKSDIYPLATELTGGAFAVALRNAGGTVKTYAPTLAGPNGGFSITDTLAPDTYSLVFNYAESKNFLSAAQVVSPLRVVGFGSTGAMSKARMGHEATLLKDGRVLVTGGINLSSYRFRGNATAEIYCPDPFTPPATPVRALAQWCPNGLGKFSPAGRGNPKSLGVGNMVHARAFHTATLLPDGTVLLAGGYDQLDASTNTAELYDPTDPALDKFTAVGNMPMGAMVGHTATLVTKGAKPLVLVAGGLTSTAQLYDVVTKTWTRSAVMTPLRFNHTASRLATPTGDLVLIAGGLDPFGRTLATTTIYDVAGARFLTGPAMMSARQSHTATAIPGGKVLLAGGSGGSGNTVALPVLAEIYDPAATTPFTAAPFASSTGRAGHTASALGAGGVPDGRVLVAGGAVGLACGQQLATSELFSGAFISGVPMTAARVSHTATVLNDGRVLIAGGMGSTCATLASTEIWNAPAP